MSFPGAPARLRAPIDLARTPTGVRHALVIGSCLAAGVPSTLQTLLPGAHADFILFNNAMELPAEPPRPIEEYDFQLLQIPIRSVLWESVAIRLAYDDLEGYRTAFELAAEAVRQMLTSGLAYAGNGGLLSFVTNFMVPQAPALGRALGPLDLRNPSYFVARLNEVLAEAVSERPNTYLVDTDAVAAAIGRLWVQDDLVWSVVHGGVLTDWDYEHDQERIVPARPLSEQHTIRSGDFLAAMVTEIEALYRTLRQIDAVKLVVVDLDDTMWRGVLAEHGTPTSLAREGWPLGMIEALMTLKRRGIMLGIVSKNDRRNVDAVWDQVFGAALRPEDFVSIQVNWAPKVENLLRVIGDANVLPGSVVFVDDNPAERAAVANALPEVRVLGESHYETRRILLWSAETQPAGLTDESLRRTEMVQAQVQREEQRAKLSREEFLAMLAVRVTVTVVSDRDDPHAGRVLELVNKTNQFNSTGERWTLEGLQRFLVTGGVAYAFSVRDATTDYGLTAVCFVEGATVRQFVMSCRVLGLEVERAILQLLLDRLGDPLVLLVEETEKNRPIRDALVGLGARLAPPRAILERGPWVNRPGLPVLENDIPPYAGASPVPAASLSGSAG